MKKMMVLAVLMLTAAVGYSQESRQDVSFSGYGLYEPSVHGNTPVLIKSSDTAGFLASYRYDLTPRSALEFNYSWSQNTNYFQYDGGQYFVPIHTRNQEFSGAYVYSRNYRKFNPFLEAGPGVMMFSPIRDSGTGRQDGKRSSSVGGVFGGGLAYEISPSFDVRVEYRGFFGKAPSFSISDFVTNRYTVVMTPSLGIAYHF